MSKPLVSICIPCHNAGDYLEATLDSLLAQTYDKIEVIVTNDASTDQSKEILDRYHEEHGIIVVTERCGSAAKSRNRAWQKASGDYIKFFDGDDLSSPEMIERQVSRLDGTTNCIASSEWGRFHHDLSDFQSQPRERLAGHERSRLAGGSLRKRPPHDAGRHVSHPKASPRRVRRMGRRTYFGRRL